MYIFWRIISVVFKKSWFLLNFIRESIFNIFFIIFVVGIYLQVHYNHAKPTKGALIIDLNGTVVDKYITNNKLYKFISKLLNISQNQIQENSLFNLIEILRQAKNDVNITGIVLLLKNFTGADQTSLDYIGKALCEFRNSGKPIYAVGDYYSQAQYYLSSYANKIYLTPQGMVDLHGIATNNFYYKSLLDKLKVHSHIFRVGIYKSAVEPFIRDNMSDVARKVDSRWVKQLWKHYLINVSKNRQIKPIQLFPGAEAMLNGLKEVNGNTAQFALNNKWVDELASRSTINAALTKIFGRNKHTNTFNGISIYDYELTPLSQQGKKIAIIIVNGAIINGKAIPGTVGSEAIAAQIYDARMDPNIHAVVFRVNSPGGSVAASEIIRSELAALRASGKPIVVSMGGMAASGGYWVSTPANYIIAHSNTLTGSIGVFGVINTLENSLDSIGVHTDGISTSPLSNISITKTLPEKFSEMMQLTIKNTYHYFITLVAQSRHKTVKEINKIGQGHIWTGYDAVQKGLVDQMGDFDDAVSKAAQLAQLKQYQLHWYSDNSELLSLVFTPITLAAYNFITPTIARLGIQTPVIQLLNKFNIDNDFNFNWNDPHNHYAFCLCRKPFLH